jgi:hypothetical protein
MNTNIEIKNIKKHFLLNIKENSENIEKEKKYTTKLVKKCFNSINEVKISDRIKKILYYSNNYVIVEDYDFIDIGQLNEKIIEKLNLTNDIKYLIFKYKNDNFVDFNDFLFNFINPKLLIFHIIESFSYLLNSLITLNNNNICFLNLSSKNIVFNLDCGEKPLLKNFQTSLVISKLNESYITDIIKNINDYTNKPLEVHLLFYLIKNDIFTVSFSFIEEICEVFVSNLTILNLFSDKFKLSYSELCRDSLRKYINQPKTEIILDILQQNEKWDVYSLSVLYLHIFGNISRVFSLKQTFINKITMELTKNINPNPSRRDNLTDLLNNYNKLFYYESNWSFVNSLPSSKITQLFNILDK